MSSIPRYPVVGVMLNSKYQPYDHAPLDIFALDKCHLVDALAKTSPYASELGRKAQHI